MLLVVVSADAITYGNEHLHGELTMIMNCDVFLGEGFGALTPEHLVVNATADNGSSGFKVYTLSRYHVRSPFCVERKREHCLERAAISSLDAFLFRSPLPLLNADGEEEDSLEFKQNTWGAENALVSAIRKKGGIIKNPCHLLQIGHLHCDDQFRPNVRLHPFLSAVIAFSSPHVMKTLTPPSSKGHSRASPAYQCPAFPGVSYPQRGCRK